jgi:hypothetical protein
MPLLNSQKPAPVRPFSVANRSEPNPSTRASQFNLLAEGHFLNFAIQSRFDYPARHALGTPDNA